MKWFGSWQTPRLTGPDITILVIALIIPGFIRAWDYSTGHDDIEFLSLVEAALPLYMWASFIALLMLGLLVGIIFKVHLLVWACHSLSFLVYFILFIGIGIQVFSLEFPWDGIRFAGVFITPLVLHLILSLRTGPHPLFENESQTFETVVKEDG